MRRRGNGKPVVLALPANLKRPAGVLAWLPADRLFWHEPKRHDITCLCLFLDQPCFHVCSILKAKMGGSKSTLWLVVTVGSVLGGYLPTLWGADGFGIESILGGMIGAFVGIWLWYRYLR